jgi:Arylsulfotransferase (ASST)
VERRNRALELLAILGDVAEADVPQLIPGRFRLARDAASSATPFEDAEKLSQLMALPYVQGSRRFTGLENVTAYDRHRAYDGVNLYTSGHAPEAVLMDMDGHVLHTWSYSIDRVWPEVPHTVHSTFWRRVHLFPNGDLLAIFEGIGLLRIDLNSRLLWAFKGGCHHEAFVTDDGMIYVLTRTAEYIPRINRDKPVLHDAITVLTPDGKPVAQYPILEMFEHSDYRSLLASIPREGDIFHTNSIYVFDGSLATVSSLYKKGNILISLLKLDTIAIVDPQAGRVAWAAQGHAPNGWKRQHDPRPLPNGDIMLFDNQGRNGRSRVVEYNLMRGAIVWTYSGRTTDDLYSATCGTSRLLPNGDILITESDAGIALELAPNKDVVWEFYNPNRAGSHGELIATLFDLERLSRGYMSWLH